MNRQPVNIVCPHCNAVNWIPEGRLADAPRCGKCHELLFTEHPLELDSEQFQRHLSRNDIPLLVDFCAPWCGPCKAMAPAFEKAATQLAPHIRLAKLYTETEQAIAAQYKIRSIPMLMLFRGGREVARQPGAMNTADIVHWASGQS